MYGECTKISKETLQEVVVLRDLRPAEQYSVYVRAKIDDLPDKTSEYVSTIKKPS